MVFPKTPQKWTTSRTWVASLTRRIIMNFTFLALLLVYIVTCRRCWWKRRGKVCRFHQRKENSFMHTHHFRSQRDNGEAIDLIRTEIYLSSGRKCAFYPVTFLVNKSICLILRNNGLFASTFMHTVKMTWWRTKETFELLSRERTRTHLTRSRPCRTRDSIYIILQLSNESWKDILLHKMIYYH